MKAIWTTINYRVNLYSYKRFVCLSHREILHVSVYSEGKVVFENCMVAYIGSCCMFECMPDTCSGVSFFNESHVNISHVDIFCQVADIWHHAYHCCLWCNQNKENLNIVKKNITNATFTCIEIKECSAPTGISSMMTHFSLLNLSGSGKYENWLFPISLRYAKDTGIDTCNGEKLRFLEDIILYPCLLHR